MNNYLGLDTGVEELPPLGVFEGLGVVFGVSFEGVSFGVSFCGSDFLGSDDFGALLPGVVRFGAL
jgi:hypothetical protein